MKKLFTLILLATSQLPGVSLADCCSGECPEGYVCTCEPINTTPPDEPVAPPVEANWPTEEGIHTVNGRRYRLRYPEPWDGVTPVRAMFAPHACGNWGVDSPQYDSYHYSQNGGFLVVIPEAENGVCWRTDPAGVDFAFVQDLIAQVESWPFIDASQRYLTGWSGGSFMAQSLACTLGADSIVVGSGGLRYIGEGNELTTLPVSCASTNVFMHHGTEDPIVPFSVGVEARDAWIQANGCSTPTPTLAPVDWCAHLPGPCQCSEYICADGSLTWCEDGTGHTQGIVGALQRDAGEVIFNP